MSIDGIGRPPVPPAGAGPLEGGSGADRTGEAFEVKRGSEATEVAPSTLLERLEQGELSVDQYLDARVEEAVTHLDARLSPEQLEFVKSSLRAELETDPVLVELVSRATGGAAVRESSR
jgi:hypothetical protein